MWNFLNHFFEILFKKYSLLGLGLYSEQFKLYDFNTITNTCSVFLLSLIFVSILIFFIKYFKNINDYYFSIHLLLFIIYNILNILIQLLILYLIFNIFTFYYIFVYVIGIIWLVIFFIIFAIQVLDDDIEGVFKLYSIIDMYSENMATYFNYKKDMKEKYNNFINK